MKKYSYKTEGTCSKQIDFNLDEKNIISRIVFTDGCNGNAKGIAAICEGMDALEVAKKFEGITCKARISSCPDQLARAIKENL